MVVKRVVTRFHSQHGPLTTIDTDLPSTSLSLFYPLSLSDHSLREDILLNIYRVPSTVEANY